MFDGIIWYDDRDRPIYEGDRVQLFDYFNDNPVYDGIVKYDLTLTAFVLVDDQDNVITETPLGVLSNTRKLRKISE